MPLCVCYSSLAVLSSLRLRVTRKFPPLCLFLLAWSEIFRHFLKGNKFSLSSSLSASVFTDFSCKRRNLEKKWNSFWLKNFSSFEKSEGKRNCLGNFVELQNGENPRRISIHFLCFHVCLHFEELSSDFTNIKVMFGETKRWESIF